MVSLSNDFYDAVDSAQALSQAGRYREAAQAFLGCLSFFGDEQRKSAQYGTVLGNAAAAMAESGQLGAAIQLTRAALAVFEGLGNVAETAPLHFNLGNMYRYQNVWAEMFEHYRKAAELYRDEGDRNGEAQCHLALANFLSAASDPRLAEEELLAVERLGEHVLDQPLIAWSLNTIRGNLAGKGSNSSDREPFFRKALQAAERGGNAAYVHEAQGNLGRALMSRTDSATEALPLLEAAYAWSLESGDRLGREYALALSEAANATGDVRRCIELLTRCMDEVDAARAQADGPAKYLLMERDFQYALRCSEVAFRAGLVEDAFLAAERCQGRTLLDAMFRHQIKRQHGRRIRVQSQGRVTVDAPSLSEVKAWAEHRNVHVFRFLTCSSGLFAWWIQPTGEMRTWEASDAIPVASRVVHALWSSPLLGQQRNEEITRSAILITEDDLLLAEDSVSSTLVDDLKALYRELFPGPVRESLEQLQGRMVMIPHGLLWSIPFDALGDGVSHLGERWQMTICHSVGVALQLDPTRDADRQPAEASSVYLIAGVGGESTVDVPLIPTPEISAQHNVSLYLPPLPGAESEAQRIGLTVGTKALIDPAVTRSALLDGLRQAKVVHLASHGVWHPLDAARSFVVLSAGERLTVADLMEGACNAEVVVLSGCQTAVGGSQPDSPLGLPSAFLTAGARSVIGSIWPVPDSVARAFMTDFYVALVRLRSVPAALKCARTDALRREGPDHLLRWAGFRLVGSPDAALDQLGDLTDGPIFAGGDVLFMSNRYPADRLLELEKFQDFRGRSGEGAIFK